MTALRYRQSCRFDRQSYHLCLGFDLCQSSSFSEKYQTDEQLINKLILIVHGIVNINILIEHKKFTILSISSRNVNRGHLNTGLSQQGVISNNCTLRVCGTQFIMRILFGYYVE